MTGYLYKISLGWRERPETPAELGRKFLQTLDAFDRIDPIFGEWSTVKDKVELTGQPLEPLRPDMTAFVEANVVLADWDGPPDPDSGYALSAASYGDEEALMTPSTMAFFVHAGGKWENYASLSVGSAYVPSDPAVVTYPLFKAALLVMLGIWPAPSARAYCVKWGEKIPLAPGEPPFPGAGYQMPWLAYLNADRSAGLVLPHDLLTERTPDGGLLMIAAETRFDPANPEHMRRSRMLAEIVRDYGYV